MPESPGKYIDMIQRERVYVQDLYGWSRLHRIQRWDSPLDDSMLWRITFPDRELLIDYNGLLPVWNPNNPEIKFHGLIEYPYQLCNPDTLRSLEDQGWRMRIRNSEGNEFWHSIEVKPTNQEFNALYSIWTESGFYNVNGIQFFGSGNMDYSKIVVRKDFKIELYSHHV